MCASAAGAATVTGYVGTTNGARRHYFPRRHLCVRDKYLPKYSWVAVIKWAGVRALPKLTRQVCLLDSLVFGSGKKLRFFS